MTYWIRFENIHKKKNTRSVHVFAAAMKNKWKYENTFIDNVVFARSEVDQTSSDRSGYTVSYNKLDVCSVLFKTFSKTFDAVLWC